MKLTTKFLLCTFVLVMSLNIKQIKSKSKHTKNLGRKKHDPALLLNDATPRHISEIYYGDTPNRVPIDRHYLWKDYHKTQFVRPFWHGIVGPQWRVPIADDSLPYSHIASPMPRPSYVNRIVPHDLPPITFSGTSFDLPMRADVLQMDVPYGQTHTRETYVDPRFPLKKPVDIIKGTIFHGTHSVDPLVTRAVHADIPEEKKVDMSSSDDAYATAPIQDKNLKDKLPPASFLEKNVNKLRHRMRKIKKNRNKYRKTDPNFNTEKEEGISNAWTADMKATNMVDMMTPYPQKHLGQMQVPIDLINKRDPLIQQYQENGELDRRMNFFAYHPQGIRAKHTKRLLPRIG